MLCRIQSRRGAYADFDPSKQTAGEFATILSGDPNATDGLAVYQTFSGGIAKRLCTYQEVSGLVTLAEGYADSAEADAEIAEVQATLSESYAVGDTGSRAGETTDNSKYYKEQAQIYKEFVENALDLNIPTFTVDFETGNLMYDGGMFVFTINNTTGNLEYEVA